MRSTSCSSSGFLHSIATPVEPRNLSVSATRRFDSRHRSVPGGRFASDAPRKLAGETRPQGTFPAPESATSARDCFQWALLCDLEGQTEDVVAWLLRATRLEDQDYWSHFYLGDFYQRIGQNAQAMEHYQAAVALRPDSPWARCNRALLLHSRGEWNLALDDFNRALASPQGARLLEARLGLGLVKQVKGDDAGARAAYDAVIASGPDNPFASAARLNRAKLDIDAGAIDRARAEYDSLLAANPRDLPARLSRALLALRSGRPAVADRRPDHAPRPESRASRRDSRGPCQSTPASRPA